jgi:hypothetical protein
MAVSYQLLELRKPPLELDIRLGRLAAASPSSLGCDLLVVDPVHVEELHLSTGFPDELGTTCPDDELDLHAVGLLHAAVAGQAFSSELLSDLLP